MNKRKKKSFQERNQRPPGWREAAKQMVERANTYESLTDEQILLKLAKNPHDSEAFLVFGHRHQKSISKMLARLFGNNRLARRALQPVLFFVAETTKDYKPGKVAPKEWITETAYEGGRVLYLLVQEHVINCAAQVIPISQIQEDFFVMQEIVH